MSDEPVDLGYARRVGERLRLVRRQRRLSLQAVEEGSSSEFKASVLGAYERGERAISVPRLSRLARFYEVPVDQLLPDEERLSGDGSGDPTDGRVTIDLRRVGGLAAPERELLGRYLGMIQTQRHGAGGELITIRQEDMRAIACLLETTAEGARRRLEDLSIVRG